MNYDIGIIGGGASGMSCALMLASGTEKIEGLKNLKIALFDTGWSDINSAIFKNVLGLPYGIDGKEAFQKMREQLKHYPAIELIEKQVLEIDETINNFILKLKSGEEYSSKKLVLATGLKVFVTKGLDVDIIDHPKVPKKGRLYIKHDDFKIRENLYVTGALSGFSTQFPIAIGTGAQTAINILNELNGSPVVVHDKPERGPKK